MESKPSPPKPRNLIQTIERASLILDRIGQNPKGMSIHDLHVGLRLPKGTIHRILSSLSYFGYARQDSETKNYFLGFKLMELGSLSANQLDLRKVAEPILRNLVEVTGETAHMVVIDRNEIVYIDKHETLQARGNLRMFSRVGARNPVHSCAVGKMLLSLLPEEQVDRIIGETGLPQRTSNTITSLARFKEHLKTVRNQGYAIDDEENERGIRCVGAPVFDETGAAVAAISVSGPTVRVTKRLIADSLAKEVMRSAMEISRRLGFEEPGRKEGRK